MNRKTLLFLLRPDYYSQGKTIYIREQRSFVIEITNYGLSLHSLRVIMDINTEAKKIYSISQVNALTGVPKPTLRFWEKEFSEYLDPDRTQGNQRRYDEESVERIRKINHLVKVEGYTIEGARRKLDAERNNNGGNI